MQSPSKTLCCVAALALLTSFVSSPQAGQNRSTKRLSNDRFIDLKALNKKHRNAVVRIEFTPIANLTETKLNPTKSEQYYGRNRRGSHGTGFFINQSEILTNAHVVDQARRGSLRMKSPACGNVEFKVELVGLSTKGVDLAVLRLPDDERMRFKKRSGLKVIPTLKLGDSADVKQSDPLAVLGYPIASDELKVIEAEVTGRQYPGYGRYRTPHQYLEVGPGGVIQPGNSGGPALNKDGIVVGIPTLGNFGSGSGWLIPSNIVKAFIDRVRNNQQGKIPVDIPELGAELTRNFPGTAVWAGAPEDVVIFELGAVIREVIPDLLAEMWGLRTGDIIVGFANRQKNLSCAIDFEGYRVVTGKMARWPRANRKQTNDNKPKIHLEEMLFMSDKGDDVTVWFIRPQKGEHAGSPAVIQKIEKKVQIKTDPQLPHLALYEKPDYELWGDLVVQEFNDFNTRFFDVPKEELSKNGVLVTYVEPSSLASRRGFEFGASRKFSESKWYIIERVNNAPVRNLEDFRRAMAHAEKEFAQKQQAADYDPERKILLKERYVQISARTNSVKGKIINLVTAFPIDEALALYRDRGAGGAGSPQSPNPSNPVEPALAKRTLTEQPPSQ